MYDLCVNLMRSFRQDAKESVNCVLRFGKEHS